MDLHLLLLQQIRALRRSVDKAVENATRDRVAAAELRLMRRVQITPETGDLSRSATERGEEDVQGEWRGTTPQPQAQVSCGACTKHMEDDKRFAFGGRLIHRRCATESVEGSDGKGDDLLWGGYPRRDRSAAS